MNDVLIVCGTGLLALFAISVIRELRKEYTIPVILTICIVFFLYVMPKIGEAVQFIQEISVHLDNSHAEILLRALGITYLTGTSSEICKSAGEPTVGNYIELAGRIEILLLCIPLFRELTELAIY